MPKSIALFTWGLSRTHGAIAKIVATLAKGFLQSGVEKIYIVYLNDAIDERIELPHEAEVIALGIRKTSLSSFAIAKFLRSYQPDIFISLAFLNIPSIIGYLLAGKVKTKLVISQHNSMIYQAKVEHKGSWLFNAQLWLSKYLYPQADALVATTNSVLEELTNEVGITFKKTKTIVIPNILDIDDIIVKSEEPSHHPWLQKKDTAVIISIARLAKQKNFPLLLNAFKIVRQQLNVKLVIFGEGKERKKLEDIIKNLNIEDSVSLPGYCTSPYQEMSKADAFVLSSEEEAFGLVLVEAMASGTPVIATDAIGQGPLTILGNNQYGLLVPNRNEKKLAEGIIKILTDIDLRKQLIINGKRKCQEYRPKIITKKWQVFLNKLIDFEN